MTPNFRWSFSQWEAYDQCPAKWKFQSVLKLPRGAPGPAAARGLNMHDSVERYIGGEDESVLHSDIARKYIPIFDEIRNHPNGDRGCEKRLGMDAEWNLSGGVSAGPASLTAVVAVLDAYTYLKPTNSDKGVLKIYEWKSGKPKDTHADQRSLYITFGMKAWLADEVIATTYYLEDTAPPQRSTLSTQSGWEKLRDKWDQRASLMARDTICAPKPSYKCRWCDYRKSAGGPCIFD